MNLQTVKNRFGIIGNSAGLNRALDVAIQVAPTDITVLITGESGTVKKTCLKSYIITALENIMNILL